MAPIMATRATHWIIHKVKTCELMISDLDTGVESMRAENFISLGC
jgi:hypothetical protein